MEINGKRLMDHLNALGKIGIGADGRRTRLAASDTNKQGRDQVVAWMKEALEETINPIFGGV